VNDDAGLIVRLKTHDLELLTQWHDLPGSRAAVYFGEDVVSHVVDYAGAAGEVYAATILGVTLNDEDVSDEIGGQLVPVVRSVTPWFATEFAVDGGCSSGERRIFDSISPLAPAYASHGFVDGTGNTTTSPAGGVVHERQVNGDRKVDITFPFPLTRVQNVMHKAGLPSTRAQLMREILEFAGSIAPGGIPTGVDMSEPLLSVMRSYPNPFNPEVTIRFRLARELPVELKVFDIRGQRVATLMDADLHAGEHRVVWNGQDEHRRDVSSGVYIVRLRAGGVEHTEKISLLK
jgi:hypothetical protein